MEENNNFTAKEILALVFSFCFVFFLIYFCCEAFCFGFNYIMFIHFLVLACVLLGFIVLFVIALIRDIIDCYKEKKQYIKHLECENTILHKHNIKLINELQSISNNSNDIRCYSKIKSDLPGDINE